MSDLFPGTKPREIRAVVARRKAALALAKRLEAAADAMNAFMSACMECDDESAPRRADDGRATLMRNMMEYAGYLESVYEKERGDR
jgi:hypothetical protein